MPECRCRGSTRDVSFIFQAPEATVFPLGALSPPTKQNSHTSFPSVAMSSFSPPLPFQSLWWTNYAQQDSLELLSLCRVFTLIMPDSYLFHKTHITPQEFGCRHLWGAPILSATLKSSRCAPRILAIRIIYFIHDRRRSISSDSEQSTSKNLRRPKLKVFPDETQ